MRHWCLHWNLEPAVVGLVRSCSVDGHRLTFLRMLGVGGLLYGGVSGVVRSQHPVIHSISCGIHWSVCGASFWCRILTSRPSPAVTLTDVLWQTCEGISYGCIIGITRHHHNEPIPALSLVVLQAEE